MPNAETNRQGRPPEDPGGPSWRKRLKDTNLVLDVAVKVLQLFGLVAAGLMGWLLTR